MAVGRGVAYTNGSWSRSKSTSQGLCLHEHISQLWTLDAQELFAERVHELVEFIRIRVVSSPHALGGFFLLSEAYLMHLLPSATTLGMKRMSQPHPSTSDVRKYVPNVGGDGNAQILWVEERVQATSSKVKWGRGIKQEVEGGALVDQSVKRQLSISAQVLFSGPWDRAPHWAQTGHRAY